MPFGLLLVLLVLLVFSFVSEVARPRRWKIKLMGSIAGILSYLFAWLKVVQKYRVDDWMLLHVIHCWLV